MITDKIQLYLFRQKWKKKNSHNTTIPLNMFRIDGVEVGKYTYGGLRVVNYNNEYKLRIGSFCSIAQNVTFILDADHYTTNISTYPFKTKIISGEAEGFSKGDIVVNDDVWIGYNSTILSGVIIGQGAVIAAGSVVTKDVPPYSIVGGVPANVIKYRFNKELIDELMKVDYQKLDKDMIMKHENELYTELLDKKQLEWLPKK